MPFKLPKIAEPFFKEIDKSSSNFSYEFDKYFLSLMVGLDNRRLGPDQDIKKDYFVDNFPGKYNDVKGHIVALLIEAELERRGISSQDRDNVERVILSLVDHESKNWLKKEGIDLLNKYSAGGMAIIWEKIQKHPTLEGFLVAYFNEFFPG